MGSNSLKKKVGESGKQSYKSKIINFILLNSKFTSKNSCIYIYIVDDQMTLFLD